MPGYYLEASSAQIPILQQFVSPPQALATPIEMTPVPIWAMDLYNWF
jgi:hypothetical protein